jgi:hypothetical protein
MNKTVLTLMFLSFLSSVRANILDTPKDAQKRYGISMGGAEDGDPYYVKDGWHIQQSYNKRGWCWCILYTRLDGCPITQDQAEAMDKANFGAPVGHWIEESMPNDQTKVKDCRGWHDLQTNYRLISGWRLMGNRWCAYRSLQSWNDANIPQTTGSVPQ